jgi:hypothetical protein
VPVVELLLTTGADPNATEEVCWILSRFCVGGYGAGLTDVAVWMVRCCHQDGRIALHKASYRGHLPIVELLVKIGKDPNVANKVRSLCGAKDVISGHPPDISRGV